MWNSNTDHATIRTQPVASCKAAIRLCRTLISMYKYIQFTFAFGLVTALLSRAMQESVLKDLEDGWDSIIIFADLSNAFDTINHQKILEKLRVYGLTESSINWYASYLSKRAQFVGLAGVRSEIIKMCRGAPQGSLSGSCLFSIVYGDIV